MQFQVKLYEVAGPDEYLLGETDPATLASAVQTLYQWAAEDQNPGIQFRGFEIFLPSFETRESRDPDELMRIVEI